MLNNDYGSLIIFHQREKEIIDNAERHRVLYNPIEFLRELRRMTRINNDQE